MTNHTDNDSVVHAHGHGHNAFDNPDMFAKKFDGPERDVWQKPDEVLRLLNLPSTATVVEIGAGTGYFTVRLAEHVKDGEVIALDAAPKMVEYLKKRVASAGFANADVRLSAAGTGMPLREQVDLVMCVDAYHHIADRIAYFSHLARYLKPEGKVVIMDRPEDAPEGPLHRTPPALVKKEMAQAGFALVEESDVLLPYQFYLAFTPA